MTKASEKKVLVVDDEPDVRAYLGGILADGGFRVRTAADGEEALALMRKDPPDFVSLDLVMPRKSGHRLLYEMRRDKRLARIPVLIVTAHARTDLGRGDMEDLMENRVLSGPGVYLEKPVDPQSYLRAVQRAVGVDEEGEAGERVGLKHEVEEALGQAPASALRRALAALKGGQAPESDAEPESRQGEPDA